MVIGDEQGYDYYIVNRDYVDNSIKKADIGNVPVYYGSEIISEFFTFNYYDGEEKSNAILSFDLSAGGTTFRVWVEATSNNSEQYDSFSGWVVFKYRSVTIGEDSDDYLTIEDALYTAKSGDKIFVKYNTSFADETVASSYYNTTDFSIKSGVILVLPHSDELSDSLQDKLTGGTRIDRNGGYVELTITPGITLNVSGTLTVNAARAYAATLYQGFVVGSNYSTINLNDNSKINILNNGRLNTLGFIYGKGLVEAQNGSTVMEGLYIQSFRGGTATGKIQSETFPFDQFTLNNIEVNFKINTGAKYIGDATLNYSGSSQIFAELEIIGKGNTSLLRLEDSGYITKKYNTDNGNVTLSLYGQAALNDATLSAGGLNASSKGKNLPFDGKWHFDIKATSKLTINSWVMLLPGSTMNIEEGAELIVSENGRLTVFNPYEYIQESGNAYNNYPFGNANYPNYYRVAPSITFAYNTPAELNVRGNLTVYGGIAGRVTVLNTGNFVHTDATETYDIHYVRGSASSAKAYLRTVKLWTDEAITISLVATRSSKNANVTVIIKDINNNPLSGIKVSLSAAGVSAEANTGIDGIATAGITFTKEDNTITATVSYGGQEYTAETKADDGTGSSVCVAEGTLITLADGSQKAVENLTGDELLLVWNHFTGKFDVAPMIFIESNPLIEYEIIHLYFSDGTDIKVIYEHAFWNHTLNRYVYFSNGEGNEYIGHWFNKQTTDESGDTIWEKVQLTDVLIYNEITTAWSPVTYEHLNFYVNGMLSMPADTKGLVNIFAMDGETMQYDQEAFLADIAEYGLFTYEEFAEIYPIPEAIFNAFGGQYLKVSIGKGLIDYDTLGELIIKYSEFFG